MYKFPAFLLVVLFGCTLPAEKEAQKSAVQKNDTTITIQSSDANAAGDLMPVNIPLPPIQKIKNPGGIYRVVLNLNENEKIEQTIVFNSDFSFHLQEKYPGAKKDSIAITDGDWTPSDGYIWLYKDQVVRGRYKWKGNTLQYYSPALRKSFSMQHLQDAFENIAWHNKGLEGALIFGVGNEPFWSVELNKKDTVSFLLPEWEHPLRLKFHSSFNTKDSIGYTAQNDSTQLLITVFPYFCSDGMSDFTYRNKIRVQYNQQVYTGCALVYK